jgi:branched-chain amino acid transport system substrate-binding protein
MAKLNLKSMKKSTKDHIITFAMVVVVYIIVQVMITTGNMSSLMQGLLVPMCTYSIVAIGLNLCVGYLGELSIGHAGFMCVGAFSSAFCTKLLQDSIQNEMVLFLIAIVVGTIAAAFFGFLIGIPVLRLRGDYLAIVTLAFGEIIKNVINVLYIAKDENGFHFAISDGNKIELSEDGIWLINGAKGIAKIPHLSSFTAGVIMILVILFIVYNFVNSRTGRAVMAIRDNRIAADGSVFKIGGIGPTTGAAAIYGSAVMNAAQIAVDEINEAGGINGYQVEFKAEDDQNDAEKSVNAYNSLKDWGMQVLMGTVTTTPCIAVADKTAEDGMFEITPSASSTDVIENDNVFQACFTDPNQGTASAQYIGENNLATKVAVIYDSSDVYSSGIEATFVKEAANQGFEVVAEEAFTADSKTDFSTQLQKAQSEGADLVFLPIYYTEASIILNQANGMGYEPTFFGCDGMDGILDVKNFDTSLAEGLMLLTPFVADADDEKTQAFVSKYKELYGDTPNQFGADAYDAIYAIKAAIEEAGVTPDMSVSDIGTALTEAMTKISVDGLTGDGMTWEATGEVSKAPKAMVIKDGAYTAM